jgi:nicotinamide-nucleotide amidase
MVMSAAGDLAQRVVTRARELELRLCTVESCTAGALAHELSGAEGASSVLEGGLVVYTKRCKVILAGLPDELLRIHSAVSEEVALAMASAGLRRAPADVAVAITGVAGPSPDEDGNPVGLVYVAVQKRHSVGKAQKLNIDGTRDDICNGAIVNALALVARVLDE